MRYKVVVSYDGSYYKGWQTQHRQDSVEEQIDSALFKLYRKPLKIVGSGRTDSKVHALGQVFHYDVERIIPNYKIKEALNTFLPKDIRILDVSNVNETFHARFSATKKRYDYFLTNQEYPFFTNYMGYEKRDLDLCAMRKAMTLFLGEHDFTSFTSSKIHELKNRIRTIEKFELIEHDYYLQFIIVGSSFLRYMVRMIVQTIIEVGTHKITIDEVKMMLENPDKEACRFKAAAEGLYLKEVYYD